MQRALSVGGMRRRTNDHWTSEEETTLREMAAQGKSRMQIALRLRRSGNAVRKRAITLRLQISSDRERRRLAS
jgi:hypothetical protein